jgi:hypothetical protein
MVLTCRKSAHFMDDRRYEVEKSERVKQSKGVDELHPYFMEYEGQKHPFGTGSGVYSSCDICNMNENVNKIKRCLLHCNT